jgi:uncharacterized phage-associated protein
MYPASTIAYAFVKKGMDEGNPISQMKLQKMVYFAHGIHLAIHQKPLIKDAVQVWKFGPVIPSLYQAFKLYGSNPITDFSLANNVASNALGVATLDTDALQTINMTWGALCNLNALQLSNWTHTAGSPWSNNYREGISDIVIPQAEMQEYFKQYLAQDDSAKN